MNIDYLQEYTDKINFPAIKQIRKHKLIESEKSIYERYIKAYKLTKKFSSKLQCLDNSVVKFGEEEELTDPQAQLELKKSLETFIPWKKGPFNIFGNHIDSEWRSDLKWERFLPKLESLQNNIIADIGCHNGYFMYRMAAHNPKLVLGFEPVIKHYFNFKLLQNIAQVPKLQFEMLGVEHIDLFPGFFDKVFCLGILYHHREPLTLLKKIYSSMKKKAWLYIDCQGIPGELPYALFPKSRYAKCRGIWFLPTESCLINWLQRTGFQKIECFYNQKLSPKEQRSSSWAPIDSLDSFLDINNPNLTIEGYPAPQRIYIKAQRA